MNIYSLETGNFKLDGGAIFGVVPKVLWSKIYPADENNLCNLSMRCLLIESGDRKILIDTGIGHKQEDKFFGYYYLNGEDSLLGSMSKIGIQPGQITDVLLTHLHFDHCGGTVSKSADGTFQLTFPNANHWVSQPQWEWAMSPNQREKASYLKENILPIEHSGKLKFIEKEGAFTEEIFIRFFNGHTQGLIVPIIRYGNKKLVYACDLIPTTAHIPSSWVCGYDTQPLISLAERDVFLNEAVEMKYTFFFEHDIYNECCTVKPTEKGIRMNQSFSLQDFLDRS